MKVKTPNEILDVFTKGTYLEKDKNAAAIIGSRQMSPRGKKLAYEYSFNLAQKGITIVSGLALGIDTVAHKAALDAGGRTIAVIGSGLDVIYPKENKELAERIIKNGCLISKFKEGTPPFGKNFLARNKIIAALSRGVVVIEGQRRSGTLSTASHAADLGIEVFAVQGSPATDWLIEVGATIANSPEDVLDYINGR